MKLISFLIPAIVAEELESGDEERVTNLAIDAVVDQIWADHNTPGD